MTKHIDFELHEFGYKAWDTVCLPLRVAILNQDSFSLSVAEISQSLPECPDLDPWIISITDRRQKPYPRDLSRLLPIGGNAERKEHSAKRKTKESFSHWVSPKHCRS